MAPAIGVAEWNQLKCEGDQPRGRWVRAHTLVLDSPCSLLHTDAGALTALAPSANALVCRDRTGHTLTMAGQNCVMFGGMTQASHRPLVLELPGPCGDLCMRTDVATADQNRARSRGQNCARSRRVT